MALNDLVIFARTVESQHEQSHVHHQPLRQETIKQEQVNQVTNFNNQNQHQYNSN